MQRVNIFGAKGGVGCTTLSVMLGYELSKRGENVYLNGGTYHTANVEMNRDLQAVAGIPAMVQDAKISDGATVSYSLEIPGDAWRIIDRGTNYAEIDADLNLFVVRNDYLSLSRMLRLLRQEDPIQRAFPPNTEFILVSEPSRSLDEKDCRNVLEREFLFHFPADNYYAIARSGDAGLLTLRSPNIGSRFAAAVLERLSVSNSQ